MDRQKLISIVLDQREYYQNYQFIPRLDNLNISSGKEITIISGIRRCGKSTLLQEIRTKNKESDYFLNFDDERLIQFKVEDFQLLHEIFIELFGEQSTFYFDEIQNIKNWERFIRRLYDSGNKIYLTGSNASMLSRELGTHLTGRYIQYELFPFSFQEFLQLYKIDFTEEDFFKTTSRSNLKKWFNQYFKAGGFPEYLLNKNRDYLKSLYESILYRDVLVRNNLTNEKEILELMYYLSSNISRLTSYNSLKNIINVKNATTVKQYLEYLQNTYLLFIVNKFDFSLKKQLLNPKKVYLIDNALANELGFHTSEDNGYLLENLVFIELKRRGKQVFYFKNNFECDFLIREKHKIIGAIQVSWSLENSQTREREISGLKKAMEMFDLNEGLILTENEFEILKLEDKNIKVLPVWQWLLQGKN